ncbi:MAG: hypothetical protein EBY16_07310 [Gammaproteobacteria bacterium]|nr:hypothetical protein [Gammaproteobacteria bacterium]
MRQTPCEAHESNQTSLPAAEGQNSGPEKKEAKKLTSPKSSLLGSSLFLEVAPDRLPTREPSAEFAPMLDGVEPPAVSSELAAFWACEEFPPMLEGVLLSELHPELAAFWACEEFASMLDGVESSVGSDSNHQENSEDCKYMAKP